MGRTYLATCVATLVSCAVATACGDAPTANQTAIHSVIRTPGATTSAAALSTTAVQPILGVHNDIAMQTHAQRLVSIPMAQALHAQIVRTSIKMSNIETSNGS